MARRTISLDEKIEKAEAAVLAAKARYDKALDELEKLVRQAMSSADLGMLAVPLDVSVGFGANWRTAAH